MSDDKRSIDEQLRADPALRERLVNILAEMVDKDLQKNPPEQWLSAKEAAAIVRVSVKRIQKPRDRGSCDRRRSMGAGHYGYIAIG